MGGLVLAGNTSGSTTLQATDAVTATITLPSATDTLVGKTTPSFTTTIGVGNATPSASGAGITFPATQSASTDANTLDDYEEGTWTATVGSNQGTATTYTIGTAYYTKVGRLVNVSGIITPTNGTLGTTNSWARINGLPFSVVSSSSTGSGINSSNYNNGVATLVAYSSTLDAAFVTGCATNNGWSFSATYFTS